MTAASQTCAVDILFPRLIAQARALGVTTGVINARTMMTTADEVIGYIGTLIEICEHLALAVSVDRVLEFGIEVVRDVAAARSQQASLLRNDDLDFLRLFVCLQPLYLTLGRGEYGLAFDWVVRSVSSYIDVPREVVIAETNPTAVGMVAFSPRHFIRQHGRHVVLDWVQEAFFYSRKQNTLYEVLYGAVGAAVTAIQNEPMSERVVGAALQLIAWVDHFAPDAAENDIVRALADHSTDRSTVQSLRLAISVGLATRPKPSAGVPRVEWARRALEHESELDSLSRVQLLATLIADTPTFDAEAFERLLVACGACERDRASTFEGEHLATMRGQAFQILEPAVRKLGLAGRAREILRLCAAWRGGFDDVNADALIVLPLYAKQAAILHGELLISEEPTATGDGGELIELTNRALSLQVTRTDVPNFEIVLPDDLGRPVRRLGREFERIAEAWLGAHRVPVATSQVQFSPGRLPLQALQVKATNRTAPISLSLRIPQPRTDVRRVILWKTDLMFAEDEAEAVQRVFTRSGVSVEVIEGAARTVSRFTDVYRDPDVDVLWVSGHAELNHFRLSHSYIELAEKHHVTASQLRSMPLPQRVTQRLLVLNVCDGASATIHSGLPEVGLSVAAAGPTQAVCSNLWPVHVLPAAAFGFLLAHGLASSLPLIDAFAAAIRQLRPGFDATLVELRALDATLSLIERIERNKDSLVPWTILDWGAAALYE